MNDHSKPPSRSGLLCAALACTLLFCASGCSTTFSDPGYAQKLRTARTDWTGKEIVGVWVSKLNIGSTPFKCIYLFRPDGSGVRRTNGIEHPFNWTYAGAGLWQLSLLAGPDVESKISIRYNGRELLYQMVEPVGPGDGYFNFVFVPADDPGAIENLLKRN